MGRKYFLIIALRFCLLRHLYKTSRNNTALPINTYNGQIFIFYSLLVHRSVQYTCITVINGRRSGRTVIIHSGADRWTTTRSDRDGERHYVRDGPGTRVVRTLLLVFRSYSVHLRIRAARSGGMGQRGGSFSFFYALVLPPDTVLAHDHRLHSDDY